MKGKSGAPALPYISTVSGDWIRAEEATDPEYWGRHLRQTVRFRQGLQQVLKGADKVLLEVGPGQTLGSLARGQLGADSGHVVLSSWKHQHDPQEDQAYLLKTLGRPWQTGAEVDRQGDS